jgi:hypothetical protein
MCTQRKLIRQEVADIIRDADTIFSDRVYTNRSEPMIEVVNGN